MPEVENSPAKVAQSKRKIELDSEDELFLEYEKKKRISVEGEEDSNSNESTEKSKEEKKDDKDKNPEKDDKQDKKSEKENKLLEKVKTESPKETVKSLNLSSPKPSNLNSPLPKTPKSLVQGKLSFKSVEQQSPNTKKEEKLEIRSDPNGENQIQDYMIDPEWKSLLKEEFEKKYFQDINKKINEGYKKGIVRPPKDLVFNAFNSTKLNQIKVVIIGQDPYHDDGQAHGLAFSVPKGISLPPSLRNIFTELKNDIPEFERDEKLGGCLQKWTQEGVFLLNTFLTVEAHKAGSHSKIGWDIFTDKVIKLISEKNSGCAFMLWGAFAQKKEGLIDKKKHKILKCGHPSPFSVTRFYGSKCFSQANSFLKSLGKTPIKWSLK